MAIVLNGTTGITTPEITLDNTTADGGQVVLKSSGFSNWNIDNYSGTLRAYYNSTENFKIDSSGRVTIPNQPAFYAITDGNGLTAGFSSGTVFPYNVIKTNIGSSYNTSNSRFTAPIAGTYHITASISFGNSSTNTWVALRIRKNGNPLDSNSYSLGHVSQVNGNQYDNVSQSVILTLSANDYIDVIAEFNTFNGNAGFGHFAGFLIG